MVVSTILQSLDKASATSIYNDEFLGMNSPGKLYYWFAAFEGKQGSRFYTFIQKYFQAKGIVLTDAIFAGKIIAPQNMFAQLYTSQSKILFKLF